MTKRTNDGGTAGLLGERRPTQDELAVPFRTWDGTGVLLPHAPNTPSLALACPCRGYSRHSFGIDGRCELPPITLVNFENCLLRNEREPVRNTGNIEAFFCSYLGER